MSSPLRVGSVPYLVGRPLDSGLENEPGIRLEYDVPARLVERLRAGDIDVALVSSVELFRRPGYRYLPEIAVSGNGPVSSVQLFLRKPVEQVATIALDPASRASAALVQVLLATPDGGPVFDEVPAGTDPRARDTDAWLRIGDGALREFLGPDAPPVFNPSQEWCRRTGLPFIFAPWIVAPGVELGGAVEAFARARERGLARLSELAVEAGERWLLPFEPCRRYFVDECRYEPGEALTPALLAFRDAAAPLGLVDGSLTPEPVDVASGLLG